MGLAECDLTGPGVYQAVTSTSRIDRAGIQRTKRKYEYLDSGFLRKDLLMDSRREAHAEDKIKVKVQIYQRNSYKVRSGK